MYEESLCSGCGQNKAVAYDNPETEGWYEAEAVTCWGCFALDQQQSKDRQAGQKLYVVDTRPVEMRLGAQHEPADEKADAQQGE